MQLIGKNHKKRVAIFGCLIGTVFHPSLMALESNSTQNTLSQTMSASANNTLDEIAYPLSQKSRVSSGFGMRADPFTGEFQNHAGIDLPANVGTAILAASNGRVKFTGYLPRYGNVVEIDHGFGYVTRYGHIDQILVNIGDAVIASQMIATVGTTGRTTGPHLHFEVSHNQNTLDPRAFLNGDDVKYVNLPAYKPAASFNRTMQYQIPRHTFYQAPRPNTPTGVYANKKTVKTITTSDEIKPRIIYMAKK